MKVTLTNGQADALVAYAKQGDDGSPVLADALKVLEHAIDRSKASGFLTLDEVQMTITALDDWIRRVHADALAQGPKATRDLQEAVGVWNTIRLSVLLKLATIQRRMEAAQDDGPRLHLDPKG
jgi:hypothetical protein